MRRFRVLPETLAVAAGGLGLMTLIARGMPVAGFSSLCLAIGAPYGAVLAIAGVPLAAVARRTALAITVGIIAATCLVAQVRWYFFGLPHVTAGEHAVIRVLSANIRNGEADPSAFVELAAGKADVIVAAELTPEALSAFYRAGIGKSFPYSHLVPAPQAMGIGMWSRYPLNPLPVLRHGTTIFPAARVSIPDVRTEPVLVGVHVDSPVTGAQDTLDGWRRSVSNLDAQTQSLNTLSTNGAMIVAGDFNCTPDVRQFRDLLSEGMRDAVEQLGAGFAPTFPSDRWYPPLITIDHVLMRNASAQSIKTVSIAGSDHRGLLAEIEIPLNDTVSSGTKR